MNSHRLSEVNAFATEIIQRARHNHARVLKITTPHGEVLTPAFMPVGTRAFVNHLSPEDLAAAGSQIILGGNTYHMLVNPGMEVMRPGGGFQVFSLTRAKHCRIDETGAHFKHPGTGQPIHMTPQRSIETQQMIGADI